MLHKSCLATKTPPLIFNNLIFDTIVEAVSDNKNLKMVALNDRPPLGPGTDRVKPKEQ